jgi:hypothetical protein
VGEYPKKRPIIMMAAISHSIVNMINSNEFLEIVLGGAYGRLEGLYSSECICIELIFEVIRFQIIS